MNLTEYLEQDRKAVTAALQQAGGPQQTEAALEKALDRLLLRYNEECADEHLREAAMHMLQTARTLLPLTDSVGETRVWKLEASSAGTARKDSAMHPAVPVLIMAGLLLCGLPAAAPLFADLSGLEVRWIVLMIAAAVVGGILLMFAGYLQGQRGAARKAMKQPADAHTGQQKVDVYIDPDKAWQCLRGLVMAADRNLQDVQERAALDAQTEEQKNGLMIYADLQLCGDLLEMAYSAESEEMKSRLKFALHKQGIEAEDYAPGRETAFECLPGAVTVTLRPALTRDDAILRKGLASVS